MQDLNTMYLFAKVVEHGSYSRAARSLGLQTSLISRRISELEKQLGVRLIHRTTRRLTITDIGHRYYQHCAALAAEALAAQHAVDSTRSVPQGLVRMACPVSAMPLVAPVFARLLKEHPLVQLHVEMTNRRVDVIEEGFDVALRVRTPPLESSTLAMRKLTSSPMVLVASPACLETHGRPKHPGDLARYPTLTMTTPGNRYVWEFREPDGTPIHVTHTPRLITDSFDALREAALAGIGIAYIPQLIVREHVARGELEVLLSKFMMPAGIVHIVFPSRRGMVPAVRALIDALVEAFRGLEC